MKDAEAGGDTHFTGEGVVGAGGRLEGARIDRVRLYTAAGWYGGIIKCKASSLKLDIRT
jgi:hypothetical protein